MSEHISLADALKLASGVGRMVPREQWSVMDDALLVLASVVRAKLAQPTYSTPAVDVLLDRIGTHLDAYNAQIQAAHDAVRASRVGGIELTAAVDDSSTSPRVNGHVIMTGAGSANHAGDTPAARDSSDHPSPGAPSRATASQNDLLSRIAQAMEDAHTAPPQQAEVADKFLAHARGLALRGEFAQAESKLMAAKRISGGE